MVEMRQTMQSRLKLVILLFKRVDSGSIVGFYVPLDTL